MMPDGFVVLLGLIAIGLLLCMCLAGAPIVWEKGRIGPPLTVSTSRLSDYELAYLSGGPRRAANTALVAMASAAEPAIEVSADGRVSAVPAATHPADQLEQAVLSRLTGAPTGVDRLRVGVASSRAVDGLRRRLRDEGLLATDQLLGRARTYFRIARVASVVAIPYGLFAIVAIVVAEPSSTAVAVWLGVTPTVTASLMGFLILTSLSDEIREWEHVPTRAGRAALDAARTTGSGPATRVALDGVAAVTDFTLRQALSQGRRDPTDMPVGWAADPEGMPLVEQAYG